MDYPVTSCDPQLPKHLPVDRPRPLMLKDYLRDDLGSCSSNGFKSLPRRQCCTTTVRYFLEIDVKATRDSKSSSKLLRTRSRATASTISALQRASEAVISAVKSLPFPSVRSQAVRNRGKNGFLPRSISRKLLRRSFWRKAEKREAKIERWKTFRDLLDEKQKPSDQNPRPRASSTTTTTTTTSATASTTTTSTASTSSASNSWSDSEFTAEFLQCSSGNSECSTGENDAVESQKFFPEDELVSPPVEAAPATAGGEENREKVWPQEEEKEQFSPVSVLDFQFDHDDDDDDNDNCASYGPTLDLLKGTKQMRNTRRAESLAQLDPVDLEKRMALFELDDEFYGTALQSRSMCSPNCYIFFNQEEEDLVEQKARELLKLITIPVGSVKLKADNVLVDFFVEKISGHKNPLSRRSDGFGCELLKAAESWMEEKCRDSYEDQCWEVRGSRKAYVEDMEEGGWLGKLEEDREEVALVVEAGVLASLVSELLVDIVSS
ncbi:uncharacterized protein LOC131164805 [Malania oleifera]|uniref:uncharacterized protein LOC131164805 n=1 Tax=Malania oleifera TaxID=397392 RepID=UPI0025AE8308|nr:uncharacterized protein LOC131164805 [Malania oleifera]XP_057978256.1 uncharacterized protein LOC131164805 [Malania oleifera]XP_057978257.1 uncharacterized protein LOC131164805 [Malania oleifera]